MKSFKDLNVAYKPEDGKKRFAGAVVSIRELVNIPIIVKDFETGIKTEQGEDRCIVSIEMNGEARKFFTNSEEMKNILAQIKEVPDGFPFETTIKTEVFGKAQGSLEVKLLECVNPIKNKWRVRWDVQEHDDGTADYMEAELTHKPTDEEIKDLVRKWYNQQTDAAILSGFSYEGAPVWLSQENQYNYKAAYDLAVQTDGKTLPVTFKFGTDESPVYRTFETLDELADFYTKAVKHIQEMLENGWKNKDAIDLSKYNA